MATARIAAPADSIEIARLGSEPLLSESLDEHWSAA